MACSTDLSPMEQSKEFSRRAFAAAGPVFLVSVGIILLLAGGLLALLADGSTEPAMAFAGIGLLMLVVGIAWGSVAGRTRPRGSE